MTGLIHIYHGDGKGKTTAAIGSAVRAAGRGKRVLIARFLKTDDSGEVMGLAHVPGITLLPCDQNFGFSWEMSAVQRKAAALYYDNLLRMAWEMAAGLDGDPGYDMLVLDDGWFGKRDDDNSGLGDWFVNEKKLGGTLGDLIKKINDLGVKFGIWVEPEMISEDSDLYRAHPDWALTIPGRNPKSTGVGFLEKRGCRSYI